MAAKISTGDIRSNRTPPAMKWGSAITFAIIGISGSVRLIAADSSSAGLLAVTLVSLCALLIIFFGDSVDWFDLKNLKVQMRKVEESKREIESLAYLTVRMAVLSHHGAVILEGNDEFDREFKKVAKDLLLNAGVSESDELFRKIEESKCHEVGVI